MQSVSKAKDTYRPAFFEPLAQATNLDHCRNSEGWREQLHTFTRDVSLKQICRTILDDEELMVHVSRSSYRHPNGFDKLIVYRNEIGGLMKIDIWWEDDTFAGGIHNHRFDFSSIVMSGALQLQHFLTIDPTDDNSHSIFKIAVLPDAPRTVADALAVETVSENMRRGVVKTWHGSMPQGASYDMECSMFHKASGTADLVTATFVVQGAPRRDYSQVVADENPWTGLLAFTPDEVAAKLTRLVNL
jgi:hypothetical protein